MALDGKECLEVARFLGTQPNIGYTPEAAQRAAISRAYFAAFCYACDFESQNGFQREYKAKDHKSLMKHLEDRGETAIADDLQRLRLWRNNCDYEKIIIGIPAQNVKSALTKADDIIKNLK